MIRIGAGLLAFLAGVGVASAQSPPVSFDNRTVTMIIGNGAGGGTDIVGRLIASYLPKYLPGSPAILVRNMPGAEGLPAYNYFATQVAADGLTLTMAASTAADPVLYRKPQSHYDPTKFVPVGGVGRGGTMLIVNRNAEPRLTDRTKPAVTMGSLTGVPRSGMLMAAWGIEYLGWNSRWVVGYPSTPELIGALERGEIDMTSEGSLHNIRKLVDSGKSKLIAQSGTIADGKLVRRSEFPDVPLFATLMEGKLHSKAEHDAYTYWSNMTTIDKWLVLPPGTPAAITGAYRTAFDRLMRDADFVERARKVTEDFVPMSYRDVGTLVGALGAVSPEGFALVNQMLRKQGLDVQ
jgi:tripartite-type tricarboxylate transporter receptor subunit TctC